MTLNIVLLEPEIPQNTGNIGRTCKAMGARLHLIEPLGFSLADKYLKRAGMDYWKELEIFHYRNLDDFMIQNPHGQKVFLSQKAKNRCDLFSYEPDVYLIFGKESVGLPEPLLRENTDTSVRVPMTPGTRSLNLANTVAILCYEVLRQQGFVTLAIRGKNDSAIQS